MPPVRVLIVDDLVLRAEVLALGLSGYPDIVVVGRLRLSDDQLGPRSAAAPADVALVSLSQRGERPGDEQWLADLADGLRRDRPDLRLVALADPRETDLIESLHHTGVWMCMDTTRSLDELVSFLAGTAGRSGS
ncbi:MAG TPA: hypothetical protein VFH38_00210 [Jatrophihabitans sp.]|nr:hypothetical protein [Jatrophihabitans sp.]